MRLEECISFLLGKAAQQVTRRARTLLAPHGVTPVQYAVMSALWERNGQSGAELCSRLLLDSATITGVVDRMEAAELLSRQTDPNGDRRIQRLCLTKRALHLRQPLEAAMRQLNDEVRAELGGSPPEFWQLLGRLAEVPASSSLHTEARSAT